MTLQQLLAIGPYTFTGEISAGMEQILDSAGVTHWVPSQLLERAEIVAEDN